MIAIYLHKQQILDVDQKTKQQINFAGNLDRQATRFFIIKEEKETILDFSQNRESFINLVSFNMILI